MILAATIWAIGWLFVAGSLHPELKEHPLVQIIGEFLVVLAIWPYLLGWMVRGRFWEEIGEAETEEK